ncbi:MAG: hypothetical protein KIT27_10635 [Legionellales bacterium]|nr:hypothetical protein [Legionellales bacterium]
MAYSFSEPTDFSRLQSKQARKTLTKAIIRLFAEWQLSTAEQLNLLGLCETSRTQLNKYKQLESIIPFERDKLDRAGLLLSIYKNIFDLYPENPAIRTTLIKRKNTLLDGQSPLDIMLEKGLNGIAKIKRFFDFQMVTG